MKRTLAIISLALLALSCAKEHPGFVQMDFKGTKAITFIDHRPATKAYKENTSDELLANGFGVACLTTVNSASVTMFNEKAVWDNTAGVYRTVNGTYYYPSTGTCSFYAVYPSTQEITLTSGAASLSYTQNPSTDLLAVKKTDVSASGNPVSLDFDHILSLVHFKAKGTDAKAKYVLKSISVKVPSSGTFAYSSFAWTASTTMSGQSAFSGTLAVNDLTVVTGADLTFIPCKPEITVAWDTYSLDGKTLVASYTETKALDAALAKGEECTVTLKLPNKDAKDISFEVDVKPWTPTDKELTLGD